ncbi:MAG: hypothetical protein HDR05_07340 [Lachnospiraceae bacterium]|nr:hypothetical protein [Lachnospiraceae bacterium]
MKKKVFQKNESQLNQICDSGSTIITVKSNKPKVKMLAGRIFDSMASTIVSGIITSLVFCLIYVLLSSMTNISKIQENIERLNDQINEYSEKQNEMEDVLKKVVVVQSDSLNIATSGDKAISIYANDSFLEVINKTYSSEQAIWDTAEQNLWEDENLVIGQDMRSGEMYTVGDLMKESIVTSYVDQSTGEIVVFKGQYDKYNQWNGNCIINRYKDNKLMFIMDAEYISGKLIRYKQVFSGVNARGDDLWMVSEREIEEYRNKGETWSYFKDSEYEKYIDINSIKDSDIIDANSFRLILSPNLEGYYNGYTSDGLFNDDTGQAYLVKYAREGYIRTLYVGEMKDGYFEDATNNAWYIAKSEDTEYMYYKGAFDRGHPVHNDESIFINNISIEEIEKILQDNNFNTGLCWYGESE